MIRWRPVRLCHGPSKVSKVMMRDQIIDGRHHGTRRLIVKTEDHDPAVQPGRVGTDVPESTIKSEHDPALGDRGGKHIRIGTA